MTDFKCRLIRFGLRFEFSLFSCRLALLRERKKKRRERKKEKIDL
jgi:hypothetical protein